MKKILKEITSLIDDASQEGSDEQGKKIQDFLLNSDDFNLDDEKGKNNIVKHKINTGGARPIGQTARRLLSARRD